MPQRFLGSKEGAHQPISENSATICDLLRSARFVLLGLGSLSPSLLLILDVPIRSAQFAADRIALIRSELKSHDSQRARILKKINLAWTLENFKFSLEIFNLAWKLQSRLKFSISILWIPHKIRGLVGVSLEIFNLAWKCHSFQSRLKISIPEGDLEFFQDLGPLGLNRNPKFRSIRCDVFTFFSNVQGFFKSPDSVR